MKSNIFLIYTCNEWKEYTSMRVNFVGTSFKKLLLNLKSGVEGGDFECADKALFDKHFNIALFCKYESEHKALITHFNNNLKFCYIEIWRNNKKQIA